MNEKEVFVEKEIINEKKPMNKEAVELFKTNYANEGDCKGIKKFLKDVNYTDKKTGEVKRKYSYLPWAVVERIFRLQGGIIEIINWKEEICFKYKEYDTFQEEEIEKVQKNLFIHLKAYWKGTELEELYPMYDTSFNILSSPNAGQLNNAKQRGMVKLIARISGIGLDIFEGLEEAYEVETDEAKSQDVPKVKKAPKKDIKVAPKEEESLDTFFEEALNEVEKEIKETPKVELEVEPKVEAPKKTTKKVVKEANKKELDDMFAQEMSEDKKEDNQKIQEEELDNLDDMFEEEVEEVKEEFEKGSEEFSDIAMEVKKAITKNSNNRIKAINFMKEKGAKRLSDLKYSELKSLLKTME